MADKAQSFLVSALTRAAATPGGAPLMSSKSEPGLFPPAAAAKPVARRAVDDGLLRVQPNCQPGREVAVITPKGLQFLLDEANPKAILDDFVRLLERREQQIQDLQQSTRQWSEEVAAMKSVVTRIAPKLRPISDVAAAILTRLNDWAASAPAGPDCPLPELYRSLTVRTDAPTIGGFHDCLRDLHGRGLIYLHPWTGPLYSLPEPTFALLVGHEVAYYVSLRKDEKRTLNSE